MDAWYEFLGDGPTERTWVYRCRACSAAFITYRDVPLALGPACPCCGATGG